MTSRKRKSNIWGQKIFWMVSVVLLSHGLSDGSYDSFSRTLTLQFQIIMISDMQSVAMRLEEKNVTRSSGKQWLTIYSKGISEMKSENGNVWENWSSRISHMQRSDSEAQSSSFIHNFLKWYGKTRNRTSWMWSKCDHFFCCCLQFSAFFQKFQFFKAGKAHESWGSRPARSMRESLSISDVIWGSI